MAKAAQSAKVPFRERLGQTWTGLKFISQQDRKFAPLALASVLVPLLIAVLLMVFGVGWGLLSGPTWILLGILIAAIAFMIVLYVRSNRAMIGAVRGQTGAAARIATTMRGDWRLVGASGRDDTPIAATTMEDAVFLLIGRPGVVLLGEGNPGRVRTLLNQEKRRLARVIGSTDMRDYIIGDDEGQLPLEKLRSTLTKLPRTITAKDVNSLETRLKALLARPMMPKGAIPKNMRPKGGQFRMTRGR